MTWADGTSSLICEICGHTNTPKETFWYQGEVAICKDDEACKQRDRANQIRNLNEVKAKDTFPVIEIDDLNPNRYLDKARQMVVGYYNLYLLELGEELHISEVFVTSFTKTLQNWKALVSTKINDGMYFEITYDGDAKQAYVDAYTKLSNSVIPDTGPIETTMLDRVQLKKIKDR